MRLHRFTAIMLVMSSLTSCTHDSVPLAEPQVTVNLRTMEIPSTKVTDADIESLQGLSFRADNGALLSYDRTASTSLSMKMPKGVGVEYRIVGNGPEAVSSIKDLVGYQECNILLEDSGEYFIMTGSGSGNFSRDTTIGISITRLASQIRIDNIIPSFYGDVFPEATVVLHSIFLINVPGNYTLGGTPSSSTLWLNKMDMDSTLSETLKGKLIKNFNHTITGKDTITANTSLFCFPNKVDNKVTSKAAPTWSPRNTRIVIRLDINGIPNYYPITIGEMSSNCIYRVKNVILTGQGSNSPDIPVERTNIITYSITVSPWIDDPIDITMD